MRGPAVGSLLPGRPARPTAREVFDELTLRVVAEYDARWHDRLGLVEYAVEDTPLLPDDWSDPVPLASLLRGTGSEPDRIVLFRRPIEARCAGRADLEAGVRSLLAEQLAAILGLDPDEVDPRYSG
jgi:predicted Zn-dependent protease with MMP-like domain